MAQMKPMALAVAGTLPPMPRSSFAPVRLEETAGFAAWLSLTDAQRQAFLALRDMMTGAGVNWPRRHGRTTVLNMPKQTGV